MKEGPNEFEVIREVNQSSARVLQLFWIYDCWSAEKVKFCPVWGCRWRCGGLAFRNASGRLVVSGSARQVRGASVVNHRIVAMSAELVFGRRGQWQARMENVLTLPISSA